MWIIVDHNIVRCLASDQRNLWPGLLLDADRIEVGHTDVRINDQFIDEKVIPNIELRKQIELAGIKLELEDELDSHEREYYLNRKLSLEN